MTGPAGLSIVVYGIPAAQGSKAAFRNQHTGRIQMREQSKMVEPWRADVRDATLSMLRDTGRGEPAPLDGPLGARIIFTLAKPGSAPKTRRSYPDRRPDLDKLLRSTLDALQAAGAIADDARIVEFTALAKVYPGEHPEALPRPGARIQLWPVDRYHTADAAVPPPRPTPADIQASLL
jgi:Holliday junction resolvase RusA-like endonuclease